MFSNFYFFRLRKIRMMFSLQTVNLKDVKAWDKPACYKLSVTVSFKLIIKNMFGNQCWCAWWELTELQKEINLECIPLYSNFHVSNKPDSLCVITRNCGGGGGGGQHSTPLLVAFHLLGHNTGNQPEILSRDHDLDTNNRIVITYFVLSYFCFLDFVW